MPLLELQPEAWATLSRLLDRALALPPEEREAWLDALPPGEREHAAGLRRLLARGDEAASIFRTLPKLVDEAEPGDGEGGAPRGGQRVGPYRLLRKLGEGGMGSVWLAERSDDLVPRPVALKLPHGGPGEPGLAERMAREREILAGLVHPHIARLYDAGVLPTGQPWLALEYVEGRAIDAHVRETRPELSQRLRLFLQVARAVAHAHGRLVVHRDLKPSNILVTEVGEVRLVDFGIAKLLERGAEGETDLTLRAGRALTPAYASPEQILGQPVSVASDVYALGVLLFELLAEARPYRPARDSAAALEEAVLAQDAPRPSEAAADPRLRRALRGDLDTIVQKALKKRPEERYSSAEALAEDVERFLSGRPVLARPDRLGYRLRKLMGRHRLAAAASALAAAAVTGGAALAIWQARVARAEERRAVEAKEFLASLLAEADPYVAGKTPSALDLLRQARERIQKGKALAPEVRVELLGILGTSLIRLQDLQGAASTLAEAREVAQRELGPDHPATLRARVQRAEVLRLQGDPLEERRELEGLLPGLRRLGDPDLLFQGLCAAADLAHEEGRDPDAVAIGREALALANAHWSERDPRTSTAAISLSTLELAAGNVEAAARAAELAMAASLAVASGNQTHPRVIQARLVRGSALAAAREPARAREQIEAAVRDAREVFGSGSTVLAYALPRLVNAQLGSGRLAEALATSAESLELARRKVAPRSAQMALRLELRGRALLAARRAAEALPALAEATDDYGRQRGRSHPNTLGARRHLALALARAGRLAEAREALPAATGQPPDPDAAPVEGAVLRLTGDAALALSLQQAALARLLPHGAQALRAELEGEAGLDELALGRPDRATASLERALGAERFQEAGPERAELLHALGRARLAAEERDPARRVPERGGPTGPTDPDRPR